MKNLLLLSLTLISYMLSAQHDSIPLHRYGHSLVLVCDTIYLFAGEGDSTAKSGPVFNDLARFNSDNGIFERVTPVNDPPPARMAHAATEYDSNMYVFGGMGLGSLLDDIWKYNPDSNAWSECLSGGSNLPAARQYHTATTVGNEIYICGGLDSNGLGLSDFWSYNPTTGNWMPKAEHPGACAGHGSFFFNSKIYVFGGYEPEYSSYRNDIWSYNIVTNEWEFVDAIGTLPDERAFFASAVDPSGSFLYIFGGEDNSKEIALSDNYKFDASTLTWTQLADGPACSYASAVFLNNTSIYLYGGIDEFGNVTDNFWEYNPSTNTWEEIFVNIYDNEVTAYSGFSLSAYPNPFSSNTTINYQLKNSSYIELKIFNINGKLVNSLVKASQEKGSYSVVWNGTDKSGKQLSPGMYVYELVLNEKSVAIEKCLLLK